MIQRIQTIYLLAALILVALLLALPLATATEDLSTFAANGEIETVDHPVILGVNALAALLILVSIFLFKNRKLQLNINKVNILVILSIPILAVILSKVEMSKLALLGLTPSSFFPIVAIAALVFANRHINKDEKLVRSADRLR